jgi:hypothetical protein
MTSTFANAILPTPTSLPSEPTRTLTARRAYRAPQLKTVLVQSSPVLLACSAGRFDCCGDGTICLVNEADCLSVTCE